MIISKKKFEEAIKKAVSEREYALCRQKDLDDRFRYIGDDVRGLERRVYDLEVKCGIREEDKRCNEAIRPIY